METRKEKRKETDASPAFLDSLRHLTDIPELAFNSTNQLITLSNLETMEYIEVNQAFLDTTGYKREEVIGKTSEDIQLYVDLIQGRKYQRLLLRLKRVSDLEIRLRMRTGEERTFLFSARTFFFGDSIYLITYYNDISTLNDGYARAESEKILKEIFDSMSSYVMILRRSEEDKFYIIDFNFRAEEVEQLDRDDVLGREISETPLGEHKALFTLLENIQRRVGSFKIPVSDDGKDDNGYYIGLLLSS
jgi:PAS domain S-box-containing protein